MHSLEGTQCPERCCLRIRKGDVLRMFSRIVCSVLHLVSPVLALYEDVIYRRTKTVLAGAKDCYKKKIFKVNRGIFAFSWEFNSTDR